MKRILLISMVCLLGLASEAFAMNHAGGMMKAGFPETMGMQHGSKWWLQPDSAEKINLSPEEQAKLNDLWIQHRRKMIELEGQAAREKFELEVLDDAGAFDGAAFLKQFEKLQQVWTASATERMKYRVAVRSLLGSDRFQQISAHMPMFGKHKRGSGKGGGCGMHCAKGTMGSGKGMMQGMQGCQAAAGGCKMMKGQMQPDQVQPEAGQQEDQPSSHAHQ